MLNEWRTFFGSDVIIVALTSSPREQVDYGDEYYNRTDKIPGKLGPYILGLLQKER